MYQDLYFQEIKRTDWLLSHHIEADRDAQGCYMTTYLSGSEIGANGVSGNYLTRGTSHRDCIDAFLAGNITRV